MLGDFCVQVICTQLYGMIGRRRRVVVVRSPALIVSELGGLALGVLPSEYGPVYVISALVAVEGISRQAGTAY